MRLQVIGNSSRYLASLGAGTSYLLTLDSGARILVDCANATHLRLRALVPDESSLSGVVMSHFHEECMLDWYPILHPLPPDAPVVVPDAAHARVRDLVREMISDRAWARNLGVRLPRGKRPDANAWTERVRAARVGEEVTIAGARMRFAPAHHGCPGMALRIHADGRTLTYLPDTGPGEGLVDLARGADLLVAHTLLLDRESEGNMGATNLSAGGAGRLASLAGARRLALAHVPFYHRAQEALVEAGAIFPGEVLLLEEGKAYAV